MTAPTLMELASSAIRGCIVAPPGRKLVVADLAGIENRVLAWLAGEQWKLQALREYDAGTGPDLYKLAYSRAFAVDVGEVTKDQRQIGKVMELALGYAGGVGAFATMAAAYGMDLEDLAAKVLAAAHEDVIEEARSFLTWTLDQKKRPPAGMSDDAFVACDTLKRLWRAAHPATVALWRAVEDAAIAATERPGVTLPAGRVKARRDGSWLRLGMPSGRALCYPSPQVEDGQLSYMGTNQYTRKWERLRTYSGKLCLAGGTLVLTSDGWVPIEAVPPGASVWDGLQWVCTEGAVFNGVREVIDAYGADMTPDHLVLTEEGWRDASQSEGLDRAACRLPDGVGVPRIGREKVVVADAVRLRHRKADGGRRPAETAQAGHHSVMRVYEERHDRGEARDARHEQAPGFCGVGFDEGALSATDAPRVAQLRRPGDHRVPAVVGEFRSVLEGHGADVLAGTGVGPGQQRRGVLTGELPLGDAQDAGPQPAPESSHRRQDAGRDRGDGWHRVLDDLLPRERGRAGGSPGRSPRRVSPVFDLLNCGPMHRFTVWAGGAPLIVHNCENLCQAVARDVLASTMPAIDAAGYRIVLSVHDELLTETPDTDEFTAEGLAALMSTQPAWAPDLPLAAEGFEATRYRK